jgi:CRISPR system Cascade subunit CasD
MEYLVFRLYGPLASWGEIAVGKSRHSAVYPSKSALLGLLAAALGIRRSDEERQAALAVGYQFAVKVMSDGWLLRDYHTTQVPRAVGKFICRTRRDELVMDKTILGTILSSREYRCDALSLVAVKALKAAPFSLTEIQTALLRPKFYLYLGRKSCPPAAPLNPSMLNANGFGQALDEYRYGALYLSEFVMGRARQETRDGGLLESPLIQMSSREDRYALDLKRKSVRYYWEGDAGDLEPQQILVRHDQPLSRTRWQFSQRAEKLFIRGEGTDDVFFQSQA